MLWQTILGFVAVALLVVGLFFAIKSISPRVERTDILRDGKKKFDGLE